jgi:hypothetical protein
MLEQKLKALQNLKEFINLYLDQNNIEENNLSQNDNFKTIDKLISSEYKYNGWFTIENIKLSLKGITFLLEEESLKKWLENYTFNNAQKQVGIIMAGNIPLVGFHDFLCGYLSGHTLKIKLSSNDKNLLPFIVDFLAKYDEAVLKQVQFVDKLKGIDAIIATGSNNSARYFNQYFGHLPHIIRKNRNSIAVLSGEESEEELIKLSDDIFHFFGLGCRNVSKLMLPENYDFDKFFNAVFHKKEIIEHNKYANNYDYNKAVYLLNNEKLLDNGFLLLKQDEKLGSPVGVVFYEFYKTLDEITNKINSNKENIQCIVSNMIEEAIPFGKAQFPEIDDYADGIDTMKFLSVI